jgi:hypothetical protein
MNKLLVCLATISIIAGFNTSATATPQYYNYNDGTSANTFPFNQAAGKEVQWLFLPGGFSQPTPAPAGIITSISFRLGGGSSGPWIFTDLTLKLGQSDATDLTMGEFYTGTLSTVYYSASVSLSGTGDGWVTITLDSPFAYDPSKSLIVDVGQCGVPGGGFSVFQTSLAGTKRVWSQGGCPFVVYAGGDASTCNVGLNIGGVGGGIGLSTNRLAFTATYGGSNPAERTVGMTNVGTNAFTYSDSLAYDTGASGWLTVLPNAGTVAIDGACVLTNSVDITGVSVGTYVATNRVSAAAATNSPQEYVVILTVVPASQTIDFAQIPNQRPTNVVHLAATASSGLPVTFAVVSGPAVLANGTNLSFTGSGSVAVRASQAGDANWNAALTEQSFRVGSGGAILDFDGDGITDIGVYRSSSNFWFAWQSTDGALTPFAFGTSNDIAIPADYDGDGFCDIAVFRPSTATWYIFGSATGGWAPMQYGSLIDLPIPADYDGDGKADFAVLRPTSMRWYIYSSLEKKPMTPFVYGARGDMPIPADYDGDGLADPAVLRPSTMTWYAYGTSVGSIAPVVFGAQGDRPVPGDYDGDGRIDYGVFRPSNVTWYIYGTTVGPIRPFIRGAYGDVPMMFPRR